MARHVVHPSRPRPARSGSDPLTLSIFVGREDGGEPVEPVAAGERGIPGLFIGEHAPNQGSER